MDPKIAEAIVKAADEVLKDKLHETLKDAVFDPGERLLIFELCSQLNYNHSSPSSRSNGLVGVVVYGLVQDTFVCFPFKVRTVYEHQSFI